MKPTEGAAWQQLARAAAALDAHLTELLDPDNDAQTARCAALTHELAGAYYDFSKQRIDLNTLTLLGRLAQEVHLPQKIQAMISGEPINASENRPVLHTALRSAHPDERIANAVAAVQQSMMRFADALHSGTWRGATGRAITDVVHIGIGGSHLGPELVTRALANDRCSPLRVHFIANIDANDLTSKLTRLNPETTLVIVVSKSWGTLETRVNAVSTRNWFLERMGSTDAIAKHFVAVTSNVEAATEFGLAESNIYPIWDWVGGRYSLWSAVGLPILLSIGESAYREFLAGAAEVDRHFATAPALSNVPALSGLLATWNYNFLGAQSLAVLAYDERLALLPEYLQQLEMESNGKSVDVDGNALDYHTMPILWGGVGTRGQHAYHQLLHQGTRNFTADFIVVARDDRDLAEHHRWLLANALGQAQAMAQGYAADPEEPFKEVPGNHPTTTIVLDALGPHQLGGLLATYEHKVFTQGAIWRVNSFDQWGVELGKALAVPIYEQLSHPGASVETQDLSTQILIERLRR